jgi:hypothetical protein
MPAEDRHRVAGVGLEVGAVLVLADRHAAGIGVLDDDDRRFLELGDAFVGRLGVADVVV